MIHHGVDAADFPIGSGEGGYCLFLGRMSPDKGAHRAVVAAEKAGVPLRMIGKMREPWEFEYFETYVKPELSDDIQYLGEVPHEEKVELLANASALLFPIRWNEPFGMVMIEAMACGTPVIAFPEGAVPEVVEHGRTGFIVDRRGRDGGGHRPARRDQPGRLPRRRRGLLLHRAHGRRTHRPLRRHPRRQ